MEGSLARKYETREELIGGRLIALANPSIRHTEVVANIYDAFRSYLRGKKCRVFFDSVDVHLTKEDIFVPDVTVVCAPEKIRGSGIYGAPDLVVEVLSPGTAKNDRTVKMRAYERSGVREYWIVDSLAMSVEQYLLEGSAFVLREVYTRYADSLLAEMEEGERERLAISFPCGIFPDLEIRLDDVFEGLY